MSGDGWRDPLFTQDRTYTDSQIPPIRLFKISPIDPLTYALVSLALIAATTLASYVPAARATAVDPVHALRSD